MSTQSEQIKEIIEIAENKLSDLKAKLPEADYQNLLEIAIAEIAQDMGIDYEQKPFTHVEGDDSEETEQK